MIARVWKVTLVTLALASAVAGLVFAEAPSPGASSTPPLVPTVSTEVCRQTCEADVAMVAFRETSNMRVGGIDCPARAQVVVPCAPYGCNPQAKTCRHSCDSDAQCSGGFVCNEAAHRCVALTYSCSGRILRGADGSQRDCSPGPCVAGACQPVTYSCSNNHTIVGTDGSHHECSPGRCVAGACQAVSYACESSRYVTGTDGSRHDCFPYHCVAGNCEHTCNSVDNCIGPTVCDQTNHCIYPPR